MQDDPKSAEFDIEEARRVLGEVFAPWVRDLGLSIDGLDCVPPEPALPDWQAGAVLRMAFSDRLCRHGGIVCGQALMALADTAMVIAILAANRGYRPMTTVGRTSCAPSSMRTCWLTPGSCGWGARWALAASPCRVRPTTSRWRWYRAPLRCCEEFRCRRARCPPGSAADATRCFERA